MKEKYQELAKKYSVALSMDGNCGCALLGENLQEGEAEFVCVDDVPRYHGVPIPTNPERWAMTQAYKRLQKRLGFEENELRYHFVHGN